MVEAREADKVKAEAADKEAVRDKAAAEVEGAARE